MELCSKCGGQREAAQRWCVSCRNRRRNQLASRFVVDAKACKGCSKMLPVADFFRCRVMKDGYQSRCKKCAKNYYGIGSVENRSRRAKMRDENWAIQAVWACRDRAKRSGLPFDLTAADIVVPELCPVLGIPIFRTAGRKTPNSPSVDRRVPKLGYVSGNVEVISWRANRLKMDETDPATFRAIAAYLDRILAA